MQDKPPTFVPVQQRRGDTGSEQMSKMVKHFVADDRGSATMEYGLVAAGLSLAIVTLLQGIGIRLAANFAGTQGSMR